MSAYFELRALGGGGVTKPGVPGFPGPDPAQVVLREALEELIPLPLAGRAVDLSARGGFLAAGLAERGWDTTAYEASAAAFSALSGAAQDGGFRALAASAVIAPPEPPAPFDLVTLILPAERGNAAVAAHLGWAARLARPGATVLIAGERDRGFARYLGQAQGLIGPGEIVERRRGLRVARLTRRLDAPSAEEITPAAVSVSARGRELQILALPGVFSAGKLDRATELLLSALPPGAGRRVLDLGCGAGPLAAFLAAEGAGVTALDDDLNAVHSTRATFRVNALPGAVLHSDVDANLPASERFDLVVTNPPFHVGSRVVLDVAAEFVSAARRRLTPGGELWLVANALLPYEALCAALGPSRLVVKASGFKVLAVKLA